MPHSDKERLNRSNIRTAAYGVLLLALGVGISRFLYTPMLPKMLEEKIFTFPQLAWLASANYGGYLVGSLLFSWSGFHARARKIWYLFFPCFPSCCSSRWQGWTGLISRWWCAFWRGWPVPH